MSETAIPGFPRTQPEQSPRLGRIGRIDDDALLDLVQRQTFRYFWDFGHPVSGMARERSNVGRLRRRGSHHRRHRLWLMAIIVGAERKWITREQAAERTLKIVHFLLEGRCFHGVFPHWLNGETGKTIRFSQKGRRGRLRGDFLSV